MARRALAITLLAAALLAAAVAAASTSVTKNMIGSVDIPAGATRALSVPFPDALRYANARYSGSHRLARKPLAPGSRPEPAKVAILESQPVEGGSLYIVRARNGNPRGSAAVRLTVIATTVEPLPHR